MKEDATAKELESLLQDALKSGLEKPRGDVPLLQLKTVPLDIQAIPRPAAPRVVESGPKSEGEPLLAEKLAPDSARPRTTKTTKAADEGSRASTFAVGMLGLMAVAAAGGAYWFSQQRQITPVATAALNGAVPASAPASSEGAIQITISRPTPTSEAAPTNPTSAPEASPPIAKTEPAPPPAKAEDPKPSPAVAAKPAPDRTEKVEKPDAKTKHVAAAPPAAAPPSMVKAEPKPVVAKKEETKPVEKAPSPTPAAGGGSVDALLQQQLKGAIP